MINDVAAVILACGGLALLVWRGFFTPPGSFGSWAMFSHIGGYRARLRCVDDESPVCPWEYEPRQDYFRSADSLRSLVRYLDEERGRRVMGDGVVLVAFGYVRVAVRNGGVLRA